MTAYTLGEAGALALVRIGRRAGAVSQDTRPFTCSAGAEHAAPLLHHPVLPGSREVGTFEDAFFAIPAKGETDRVLRAARRALDAARMLRRIERRGERVLTASERLVARLSAGAVRVLEELLALARLNRGRVYPSYDHLARVTGLGRATVARGLKLLEEIGFLLRQRRFARLRAEGAGPRITQTSNAYRLMLPQTVLRHLPRWLRPAPLPVDAEQQAAERAREQAAMRQTLSCRELALATLDGPLGRMLAKLGAAIDAREAANRARPSPTSPSASLTMVRNPLPSYLPPHASKTDDVGR
ncbi:helix-turn-helix domain-containing protein [uncultured Sphingomonas sp.]|uniref:helix-turn-helix domain-containing protein n=1 Tax=uncultured Sphingomonas sp. TaxID=158754 RepID=UPI0026060193|nr:helix-turn-helix domain-containing protein [uncultured Sphingomonas sp.]